MEVFKIIGIAWTISSVLFVGTFLIERMVDTKLSEKNKFKKWWRKHIVGDFPTNVDF